MARKAREVYTRGEVDVMLHNAAYNSLNKTLELVLSTGTTPNPELGQAIMSIASEVKAHFEAAASKSNEANLPEERFHQLGAVLDGIFGTRPRS